MEKKLLIVDDNKYIRNFLKDFLDLPGCSIDTAENGKEAVEMFSREKYFLVITDVDMPEMDGTALSRYIKLHYPYTYIIVMSGENNLDSFAKMGIKNYFSKPLNLTKIRNKILEIIS
ncbi:MAG: response regulator [Spirochaetes bacterium]|nr:response regulator [Spirochaetota bacterium]